MRFLIRVLVIVALCLPLGGCFGLLVFISCLLSGGDGCDEYLYTGPGLKFSKGLVEGDARLSASFTSSPCTDMGGGRHVCDFSDVFSGGVTSDFTVDLGDVSDKYALIVQMPLSASDFDGRWHRGDFDLSNLEISDGLLQVPIDKDRTLLAEPGHQLLVIDGEFAEIPFGSVQAYMDYSPNQAAPLQIKVLQAAIVKVGSERFYPPILPCVTDMAGALEFNLPTSEGTMIPVSFLTPEGCKGEVFSYFLNSKAFRIQACMSGSWSDANFNGQGFLFEILDNGLVLVYWFSFDDTGAPVWMFGVGEIDGTKMTVTLLYDTQGPIFGPGWDVADFIPFEWGTVSFEFTSYTRGTATFTSLFPGMFPSHPMEIRRGTNLWGPPCQPSNLELAVN